MNTEPLISKLNHLVNTYESFDHYTWIHNVLNMNHWTITHPYHGRRRYDFKSLRLPKFQTSFHGNPRTYQHVSTGVQNLKPFFTWVIAVCVTQKIYQDVGFIEWYSTPSPNLSPYIFLGLDPSPPPLSLRHSKDLSGKLIDLETQFF